MRWAKKHNLTKLEAHRSGWAGPLSAIDTEGRWQLARRLLTDDTIDLPERVAGLLVLLYAQWPATITRLTTNHVEAGSGLVLLHLAQEPVVLPEPLCDMILGLTKRRQNQDRQTSEQQPSWLFPGRSPSQPISALTLTRRLHNLGIHPRQARSTALSQLATQVPAAVISRMLGIHIEAATTWQRASNGDG